MKIVFQNGQGLQIPTNWEMTVKEAGYIFVYLSYEDQSNNYVEFDDFKITHTKSNLIQASEYYPFGMQTANSWTRENNTGNNFLANGGTELNSTSNLYDLEFRNYDPVLGRMNGVDPMASMYSSMTPYNFSFNDPVTYTDPSGATPEEHDIYWYNTHSAGSESLMDPGGGGGGGGIWNPATAGGYGVAGAGMYNDYSGHSYASQITGAFIQRYHDAVTMSSYEYGKTYGEEANLYENYTDWYQNGEYVDSQFTGYTLKTASGNIVWSNVGMFDYYGDYDQQTGNGPAVIDNTKQAWNHYMNGNGASVDIGPNSINALIGSKDFKVRHDRITSGKTTALSGNFSVNMTSTVFHIGRTTVDYSIQCSGGDCYVEYTLFRGDGFWDVDFIDENIGGRLGIEKYQPDGLGPNLERLGGTPYRYNTTTSGTYFKNPGY